MEAELDAAAEAEAAVLEAEAASAALAEAQAQADAAAAKRFQDASALNYRWGPFRMTLNKVSAWGFVFLRICVADGLPVPQEVPGHRLQKTMVVGAGQWCEESLKVELALKAWAARAPQYDRQFMHLLDTPIVGTSPDVVVLDAQCP